MDQRQNVTVYVYRWRTDDPRCSPPEWSPKRPALAGRRCRVLARGKLNSALVEFCDTGEREIVSRNALRKSPTR